MQTGTCLIAAVSAMLLGGPGEAKSGTGSDAIEIIVLIVNDSVESKKREQAAVKGDAILEPAHRHDNVGDSVYLHPCSLYRIFTLRAD